jgi:hypothetical protein
MGSLAANNPSHRRIMPQPLGVVHILVSRETAKDGLPKHPGQCVSPILAGAGIGESFARQRRQPERRRVRDMRAARHRR